MSLLSGQGKKLMNERIHQNFKESFCKVASRDSETKRALIGGGLAGLGALGAGLYAIKKGKLGPSGKALKNLKKKQLKDLKKNTVAPSI